ncbi:hypothetical protein GCM10022419_109060 [Nonomuraea rosea]|uniref:Uncharacterized protein n=1 Tax=Nonomuraea rosea TaxID=638574 RepID=A0ABP6ZHI1_9ACTN
MDLRTIATFLDKCPCGPGWFRPRADPFLARLDNAWPHRWKEQVKMQRSITGEGRAAFATHCAALRKMVEGV